MSVDESKPQDGDTEPEVFENIPRFFEAKRLVEKWRTYLELDPALKIEVQIGDFRESGITSDGDKHGCTIASPDRREFIIALDPQAFGEKLEHIVVHELCHVYTIAEAGESDEAMYELAVDQLARMVQAYRELEMDPL